MTGLLHNRIALITGASRGIGHAVARQFAREGAQVICVARTLGALEELDDLIGAEGGSAVLVPQDLTQEGAIEKMASAIAERFGRLDILVGNAATLGNELVPIGHGGGSFISRIMDLNVTANWRLIDAFGPLLRASEAGKAVFVTDPVAQSATPFWGGYAASKVALEKLVLTWAAEIANITRIKVNLIAPPPTASRLRAQAFPGLSKDELRQPEQVAPYFVDLVRADNRSHGQIFNVP